MTRPRVVLTRRWPATVEQHFAARFDTVLNPDDRPLSTAAISAALGSCDALCPTVSDRLSSELFKGDGIRAQMIGNFGAGYNHIDTAAAAAAGIIITNTPDVVTESTADIAIALMLMVARRLGEGERTLRGGAWAGWGPTDRLGIDVTGKTLGLVGFGRIAQAVGRRAHFGFVMTIRYFARNRADAALEAPCHAGFVGDLATLVGSCDFISLHVPGSTETRHMIDARLLAAMRPHAVLINTARGDVIDEAALCKALAERQIAGAGLDVYTHEPHVPPALLAHENVVLLPHLGSATLETRTAMGMRVFANIDAFFAGREPPDRVA